MADWKEQSLQFWAKIGKRQQYTMIGVAALLLLSILGWSYWWGGRPDMVPLFTDMETKDAGEVAAKLKEMKITFEPQESSRGTAIMVQAKDVHAARMDLATQGLPRGQKGFELFEDSKLGVTEFQNKVNYLQALQGELTRTIQQLEEIESARVHIVLPEDSLYKKNEKLATASIMLRVKPDAELTKRQIKGIVNLTAHSIQGLQAENITIVDSKGRTLNDMLDEAEEQAKGLRNVTLDQLEMTKRVKDRLQQDVQQLLDQALGAGKAFAQLSVELDFDQRIMDRQAFTPSVDDSGIVRSEQQTAESYSGTTAPPPGGPAGTASNIPGYVAANGGQSQYDKKEVTKNYEINETKEKVIAAPGAIKRLTIAVLVDEQITANQQDSIARAVSSAVGLNTARGDTVSVEPLPFSTEVMDRQAREEQAVRDKEQQTLWLQVAVFVLILAGIAFFFYMRRRKERLLREAEEQTALEEQLEVHAAEAAAAAVVSAAEEAEAVSPEEQARLTERQILEELIRAKPDEVAQLVRTWLSED